MHSLAFMPKLFFAVCEYCVILAYASIYSYLTIDVSLIFGRIDISKSNVNVVNFYIINIYVWN